jgi:hypothetical protein
VIRASSGTGAAPVLGVPARFPMLATLVVVFVSLAGITAEAQQAIPAPGGGVWPHNVRGTGLTLAQHTPAIETSRLRRDGAAPAPFGVDGETAPLEEVESTSSGDDSLGAQQILKSQERQTVFVVSGGVSGVYTSNVALAAAGERSDAFLVANAAAAWMPRVARYLEATLGANASFYRYDRTPALDFESLNFNAGVAFAPPRAPGVTLFARYDFTQLLDSDGRHILRDHVFTVGVQRAIAFGRSHGLLLGVTASVGFADPSSAQRDQLGAFIGYRLQLTRRLETDLLLRPALHFYDDFQRTDFNQIVSWNLRYRFTDWAELNAYLSHGFNRSEVSAFDYDVLTTGGGVGVLVRF